jgi:hypothetical protein
MNPRPAFEEVWKRVITRSGEVFFTKTGLRFTYIVDADKIRINRVNYTVAKSDLLKAYEAAPVAGPSELASTVRGPTYVQATATQLYR